MKYFHPFLVFIDASDQCVTASFGFDTSDTSSSRSYDIQVSVTSISFILLAISCQRRPFLRVHLICFGYVIFNYLRFHNIFVVMIWVDQLIAFSIILQLQGQLQGDLFFYVFHKKEDVFKLIDFYYSQLQLSYQPKFNRFHK